MAAGAWGWQVRVHCAEHSMRLFMITPSSVLQLLLPPPLPSRSPGTYLSGKVSPIFCIPQYAAPSVDPWSHLPFLFLRLTRRPPASRTAPRGSWRALSSSCRELSTRLGAGRVATCSSDAGKRQFNGCWPSGITTDEYQCTGVWMYSIPVHIWILQQANDGGTGMFRTSWQNVVL